MYRINYILIRLLRVIANSISIRNRIRSVVFIFVVLCFVHFFYSRKKSFIAIVVVEEHHEVLGYWFDDDNTMLRNGAITVVHIDGHSDEAAPEWSPEWGPAAGRWPQDEDDVSRMMQRNDNFIQISALAGFLKRFIWIYPSWSEKEEIYEHNSVDVGIFKSSEKSTPIFCECRQSKNMETCFYVNFTLLNTQFDEDVQIPKSSCFSQTKYTSEAISELYFEKGSHHSNITQEKNIIDKGSGKLFNDKEVVIWDIDLDYFGVELPSQLLQQVGLTTRQLQLMDVTLEHLFCPNRIEHELSSNDIMEKLFRIILSLCHPKNDGWCIYSLDNLLRETEIVLIDRWKTMPSMFCARTDLELRKSWKTMANILMQLKSEQITALITVGFCFNISPKTYGVEKFIGIQVCRGLNEPDTKMVQIYKTSVEDINARMRRLEGIFGALPAPSLITVCRSARDGYVPRQWAHYIETLLLETLEKLPNINIRDIIYDQDLLGGRQGWVKSVV